jgi:hypothetical protein
LEEYRKFETKSNLFFAKGLIFVEGWAEEILIPSLAKKNGFDLTKYGVSHEAAKYRLISLGLIKESL